MAFLMYLPIDAQWHWQYTYCRVYTTHCSRDGCVKRFLSLLAPNVGTKIKSKKVIKLLGMSRQA